MPHILPTSENETIGKEIGDCYPIFYNACAWSPQSAHRLEETICCLKAWSIYCSLFCCLWLEAGECFSLNNYNILCLRPKWYCVNTVSTVFLPFSSKTNARARQDLYESKQDYFSPHPRYNPHKTKVPCRGLFNVQALLWLTKAWWGF